MTEEEVLATNIDVFILTPTKGTSMFGTFLETTYRPDAIVSHLVGNFRPLLTLLLRQKKITLH